MGKENSSILKATGLSVIIALFLILIFGFIIKIATLSSTVITPVNQFIKIISVFLGCFFVLKNKAGFLKGLISGLLFSLILHLIFFCINGKIDLTYKVLVDIVFCSLIGMVSGILAVNIKGK